MGRVDGVIGDHGLDELQLADEGLGLHVLHSVMGLTHLMELVGQAGGSRTLLPFHVVFALIPPRRPASDAVQLVVQAAHPSDLRTGPGRRRGRCRRREIFQHLGVTVHDDDRGRLVNGVDGSALHRPGEMRVGLDGGDHAQGEVDLGIHPIAGALRRTF